MNILVILANAGSATFNHALAQTVVDECLAQGCQVVLHDLYAENFPAILPAEEIPRTTQLPDIIQQHCQELVAADGIVIIHPNWWGQPPAILKGWIDRIIRPGVAYEFIGDDKGEGVPRGLLKAKAALVLNTSNTEMQREQNVFGDPLQTIWKNCIFDLCGITRFYRRVFNIIVTSSSAQRQAWLQEARTLVTEFLSAIANHS